MGIAARVNRVKRGAQHARIGAAWNTVAPLGKRLCFREHLEWAERQGVLVEVFALIKSLTEEEWFHMEDA